MDMGEIDCVLRSCSSEGIERARMPNTAISFVFRYVFKVRTAVNSRVQGLDSASQHLGSFGDVRNIPEMCISTLATEIG